MKSSLLLARVRKNWMCLEIIRYHKKEFKSLNIGAPIAFKDKINKDFIINRFVEKGVKAFYYTAKHNFTGLVYYD